MHGRHQIHVADLDKGDVFVAAGLLGQEDLIDGRRVDPDSHAGLDGALVRIAQEDDVLPDVGFAAQAQHLFDVQPIVGGIAEGKSRQHDKIELAAGQGSQPVQRAAGIEQVQSHAGLVERFVQAGGKIADTTDERTGVPVYSLYGPTRRPTPEMLKNVDVLVYDIQDVGARFYTYISTMGECMEAAADKGIPFIVLDRPNPLADTAVEGRMIDLERFKSFVGAYAIPIRYGLTIGELAGIVRDGMKKDVKLTVVKMKNYRRSLWYDETGLPWIAPSPNLPSLASATVYPGMCLFEGTNLSEGRGTMQPFETVGAPWLDAYKLVEELTALKLEGVLFRPVSFTPTSSKHQGQLCQGIQLHVTDRQRLRSVKVALHVLSLIRKNHPAQFQWRDSSIDRLSGSDELRLSLDKGLSVDRILASWDADLKKFDGMRKKHFLYQ